MSEAAHRDLHPGPPSPFVRFVFYGGPRDGLETEFAPADSIPGSIPMEHGKYQMIGFRNSGRHLPQELQELSFDNVVYLWGSK